MDNIDRFQMKDFFVWAHRGRNRAAPENTMAAFECALDCGDKGIELDVRISADGKFLVIHDDTVDRTSNGTGAVSELDYADIYALDAGSWFSPEFKGEHFPLLDTVLAAAKGRACVNVEIKFHLGAVIGTGAKKEGSTEVTEALLELIRCHGILDEVLISCFDWGILGRVRKLDRNVRLGVLVSRGADAEKALAYALKINAYSIHPELSDVLEKDVRDVYSKFSGRIYPYTINTDLMLERVEGLGLDGCFANFCLSV